MRQLIIVIACVAVVAALEALYNLARYFVDRRRAEVRRRLASLGRTNAPVDRDLLRPRRLSDLPWLDAALRSTAVTLRLERLLAEADLGLTVAQLLGFSAGSFFAVVFLGGMLAIDGPLLVLLCVAGGATPIFVVMMIRDRRTGRITEQLADALEMMSRSLRAGHSIPSAFQFVASEMPPPINVEFGRAYEEQRLGKGLQEAVQGMAARLPGCPDLRIFAVSVTVQSETGGNLAEILESIAATIQARFRFYGKVRALTAEGRTSGIVLGSLPILMMAFLLVANPEYLKPLFESSTGTGFLLYSIGSWSFGLFWMFRMTKLEL